MDVGIDADVDRRIESSDRDFAGYSGIAACRNVSVIEDRRQRPSRLLRSGSQAAEKARNPEADAVFVGQRRIAVDATAVRATQAVRTRDQKRD